MSIECKCDVTALCSDMASDALKTTGVAKEQNSAKGNAHRVQSDQREAAQSDEADCEEGSRKQPEGPKGPEPPHHARRPMNAFLIFCKRHRGVVRDRFPHLENRSVTKILGEWWANLEAQEKASYTELAKQYKEAFLQANPDFKWYKLPAPPLRTLVTRPSNQTRPLKLECDTACGGPITPGKLADETQMGSLSSLLASLPPPPPGPAPLTPPPIPPAAGPPKPPKKRYLQELGAGEAQHSPPLPMPPVYRLRMAASEETDRNTESRSPFRQLRPSSASPQKAGALSEGTTLKTSKQDIIDRVVDRMCRLADGEGVGSKLSDNNNDAQYPSSRERSLVGDIESRCCTGTRSQKSLFGSCGSPGPPDEGNGALEGTQETNDGKVSSTVSSGFEESATREKELSAVQEGGEQNADYPVGAVAAGRKCADEMKDSALAKRDGVSSSFSSDCEAETVKSTVECLKLKKTKASFKEFQKKSCEAVGDSATAPSSVIGGSGCSSTRANSFRTGSDAFVEKTEREIKAKVSKDLSSSFSTITEAFSVSPQGKGPECRQRSPKNVEWQMSTNFECLSGDRSSPTDQFTGRDCVTQLSSLQDRSSSCSGTKNEDCSEPTHVQKDDNLFASSTAASRSFPSVKSSWKKGHLSTKIKKLHRRESTDNIKNVSVMFKYPAVPDVSTEGKGGEESVSCGNGDRPEESAKDFSDSKLEGRISSDVCRQSDAEEVEKIRMKKMEQKLLQVKPSVQTVESATQFDGDACSHGFVSQLSKNKRAKVKNVCPSALVKYHCMMDATEGKDGGKIEELAKICSANDSDNFPPLKGAGCKGERDTSCNGEVKVKTASKVSSANTLSQSPLKKPGKLKGTSKKREHFCVPSEFETGKIVLENGVKRLKVDNTLARDLQTKNVPVVDSANEGLAGDGGAPPEGRNFRLCDQKRAIGSKASGKGLDLKVYAAAHKGTHKETVISGSKHFKSAASTICSVDANKGDLGRVETFLCEVPLLSASSESRTDVQNSCAVETGDCAMPSDREVGRTCDELSGEARTGDSLENINSEVKTDSVELMNICASKGSDLNSEVDKTCDPSTPSTRSKLVRTTVPVESYEGGSISVVEESSISELTASTSAVVLDIDLDLTQTRLSPQGLADLAAKDGVVVLTLPADDELVLPPLLAEPPQAVVTVQPAAVECLEAAIQTHADAESQDAAGSLIVGDGALCVIDKDASSIESEDSRDSIAEGTAASSAEIAEAVPVVGSNAEPGSAAVKDGEGPPSGHSSSGADAQMLATRTAASECLPVVDVSAESSASTQKSEESCDGELSAVRRKSTRTCKGLRYHQFMVEGRLKKGHRRPLARGSTEKVKTLRSNSCALTAHSTGVLLPSAPVTSSSDATCALPSVAVPSAGSSNARSNSRDVSSGSDPSDAEMDMPLEMRNCFSTPDNLQRICTMRSKFDKPLKDALEDSLQDSPAKKRFRAADFNLEEKIEALPSLSLEEFQMKKKARKRKPVAPLPPPPDSRPTSKQTVPSPAVSPDSTEGSGVTGNRVTLTVEATAVVASSDGSRLCSTSQLQNAGGVGSSSATGGAVDASRQLVGSQKRKARKQSITRLDSDNVHILRDTAVVEPAVLSNIALSSLATIAVTGSKLVK